ncbi:septum site-determining protein MinC [Bathymodiolus japonicus methanotrophic gill symbiont]|uniref:septum site-determining protein MinC n=1 Tax=Bathymodiolus japonicus methanotrophic gill symbiont TaxID=113269 RepID=UPI001B4DBCDA|nr:septum site-determining protein MinC [Bathymodiolus japonicus methanotrophic gill symbiont]GFO72053.1 septum site-determining protein MinC [Bathymodiolus japonicus methanotrophic gill symbiont]
MPSDSQPISLNSPAFEFKSGVVTIPALNLLSTDINAITHQLQEKINQAPGFFSNSSLLIDLQALPGQDLNLASLVEAIRDASMFPIGIRGGNQEQQQAANDLMLPVLSAHSSNTHKPRSQEKKISKIAPATDNAQNTTSTRIETTTITQPIRSGQRIYAKGDLVIIAQVSAGAEIMAEGNIHVYGTLRGRVLAGVQGNEDVRIFSSNLQAELVSIAGNYRVSEGILESERNAPVQIYLNKQAIIIQNT